MRVVGLVACIVFFAASGSALAAECGRGMLWPHVRNPGDCLTDAEIKAGQTGVYNGPVNTNVDVSAIKPDPVNQNAGASGDGGGFFSGGLLGGGSTQGGSTATCNKGWFWPFVRETGDCQTDIERRRNRNGVYRADEVTQVSAVGNASAPAANAPIVGEPASAAQPAAAAPACTKGWLWPFVRHERDCPSEGDKK